jgi:hypothetical protein
LEASIRRRRPTSVAGSLGPALGAVAPRMASLRGGENCQRGTPALDARSKEHQSHAPSTGWAFTTAQACAAPGHTVTGAR